MRLISGQESGLLVVIALMIIGLTLSTRSISKTDRFKLADSASVSMRGDDIIVKQDSGEQTYRAADGYELIDGGEARFIKHTFTVNRFFNKENLVGVAKEASFIAVMAVGIAGIIIMGGIDLSIGSVYALSAVLGAKALHALGGGAPLVTALPVALIVCCGVGAACGAVNGIGTVGLRVHPFIITLGGMAVYRGIAFVITEGQSISDLPESFTIGFVKKAMFGVNPVPLVVMFIVAIAGGLVLRSTVFGRRTFAIGGNEVAGRYAGIPVDRIKIMLYSIGGLLAGLSAAMMLGYYGAVSSDAGNGYELNVIAAAVVGGASLSGGRGSAIGAMLGALVIQLIDNGIVVLEINSSYKLIIIGLAIVVAVVVDQAKHKLTSTGR